VAPSSPLQAALPFDAVPVPARLTSWAPELWPVAQDWRAVVDSFWASDAAHNLGQFLQARLHSGATVYPPQPLRALELTALAQVKVVILGQDPYHGAGQAQGLAFSVAPGIPFPPSLRNIFKEIARDPSLARRTPAGQGEPGDASLERWARQGVLLLNTCLTVEEGAPGSHAKRGWEVLTDAIVSAVAAKPEPVVFLLWGAHAQAKRALIEAQANPRDDDSAPSQLPRHLLLMANHPSPLSALRPPTPFMGCGHFGLANQFLALRGGSPVDW